MKKAKNDSAYFIWSALIVFCVIIAVFTLAFASCAYDGEPKASAQPAGEPAGLDSQSPESNDPGNANSPDTTDPGIAQNPSVELAETEDMGQEYIDKFVFLGDSTTYGLAYHDIVNDNQVWTPTNGTLTLDRWNIDRIFYPDGDEEIFITEAVAKKKPEYMLITLGVNGVSFMSEDVFVMNYKALVEAIQQASPDTKIILNTIYPVAAGYDPNTGITNEKIDAANGWIRQLADDTGVRFLNSASILKDETGAMNSDYHFGDYIHLNADSFRLVASYIRTHGYV